MLVLVNINATPIKIHKYGKVIVKRVFVLMWRQSLQILILLLKDYRKFERV
jgi:hypothetical protein